MYPPISNSTNFELFRSPKTRENTKIMSDTLTKREFVRHASRYLIPNKSYILKGNPGIIIKIEPLGKKELSDKSSSLGAMSDKKVSDKPPKEVKKASDKPLSDNNLSDKPKVSDNIDTIKKLHPKITTADTVKVSELNYKFSEPTKDGLSKHGCGCDKVKGKMICSKHNRL